jgi:hypothetical protein
MHLESGLKFVFLGWNLQFYQAVKHKCKINAETDNIQNIIPSPRTGPESNDMQTEAL